MKADKLISELLMAFSRYAYAASDLGVIEMPVSELEKDGAWKDWPQKVGVYYFRNGNEFLYVGRALLGTRLGARIWSQRREGDEDWKKALADTETRVGLVGFPDDLWFLAPSLEMYLVDILEPRFNKKRG